MSELPCGKCKNPVIGGAKECPSCGARPISWLLPDYLKREKLSQRSFGLKFSEPVTQGLVWQWTVGKTRMTADQARELEQFSGGAIKRWQSAPHLYEPPVPATTAAEATP